MKRIEKILQMLRKVLKAFKPTIYPITKNRPVA